MLWNSLSGQRPNQWQVSCSFKQWHFYNWLVLDWLTSWNCLVIKWCCFQSLLSSAKGMCWNLCIRWCLNENGLHFFSLFFIVVKHLKFISIDINSNVLYYLVFHLIYFVANPIASSTPECNYSSLRLEESSTS